MERHFLVIVIALVVDRATGDPDWLWLRFKHPVEWFGKLIAWLDRSANCGNSRQQKTRGVLAIVVALMLAVFIGWSIAEICRQFGWLGLVVEAVFASFFLAQKSLMQHVAAVNEALVARDLAQARMAVAGIVGRDPNRLDETGVCRAAIESLAENSSDGVIAPVFWYLLFGLSGLCAYKMLNTADSMLGHKCAKYCNFGFASAKLDDWANFLPARMSSVLITFASFVIFGASSARHAWAVVKRDARRHRSPNAGWPESAFAGALNIQLCGPRIYNGVVADEPYQNATGAAPVQQDIACALKLFATTMNAMTAIFIVVYLFLG